MHEVSRVLFVGVGVCVLMPVRWGGVIYTEQGCEVWEIWGWSTG